MWEATQNSRQTGIGARRRITLRLALGCLSLLALAVCLGYAAKQGRFDFFARVSPIGNLRWIRAGSRVHIRGVVTYYDSDSHSLYVQDGSGAIHIGSLTGDWNLHPGQQIDISGEAEENFSDNPGPRSVALSHMQVNVLAESLLPAPIRVAAKNFPPPGLGTERIELRGVVRAAAMEKGRLVLDFALKENGSTVQNRFNINVHIPVVILDGGNLAPSSLVDAELVLQGVLVPTSPDGVSTSLGFQFLVPDSASVRVDEPPPLHPALVSSIRALLVDPTLVSSGHRLRLRGTVTTQDLADHNLVVADDTCALPVHTTDTTPVKLGDSVELQGFPVIYVHTLFLQYATFRLIEPNRGGANLSKARPQDQKQQQALPVLTTVQRVRGLSAAQANLRYPIHLRGVVTYYNTQWRHFFFQDSTAGIFVDSAGQPDGLHAGQEVELNGITDSGDYAPIIVQPRVASLGKGHLPTPRRPSVAEVISGDEDGQWIEVDGIVHPIKSDHQGHAWFDLYTDLGPMRVDTTLPLGDIHADNMADAKVRVRGVMGVIFNEHRQLTGPRIFLPSMDFLTILQPAPADPFSVPAHPINHLLQYSPKGGFNHRVRVEGVVSMNPTGDELYIEDGTGGLLVQEDDNSLQVGDRVEAVGYAMPGEYSPVLGDAIVRRINRGALHSVPLITPHDALTGDFNNQLVAIEGRLLSHVGSSKDQVLVMQNSNFVFDAHLETSKYLPELDDLPDGSTIRVTGICAVQIDPSIVEFNGTHIPQSFQVLLRSPDDIHVLQNAPWWTLERALGAVTVLLLLVAAAVIWVVVLRIKVRTRTAELVRAEKLAALGQLAAGAAHELNNPLTGIMGYIQILLDDTRTDAHREKLGKIEREARRMRRIIENLINFARPAVSGRQPSDIETLVRRALILCEHNLKNRDINVSINFAAGVPRLDLDENQLTQVFLDLFNNSADALEEVSDRKISVEGHLEGDRLEVSFSDTGPGFPDVSRVFDPFYTTKPAGKGAGLGLSICYGIVTEHGGRIEAHNLKPNGAEVTITLPVGKTTYLKEKDRAPAVPSLSH